MLSQSMVNFYKVRLVSAQYLQLKPVFENHSYEIFQFLGKEDLKNLKLANKFFCEICDCHSLFEDSINSLQGLFKNMIVEETKKNFTNTNQTNFEKKEKVSSNNKVHEVKHSQTESFFEDETMLESPVIEKKSKFREKYNFNKSMNEFYKGSIDLSKRLQSGKNRSNYK